MKRQPDMQHDEPDSGDRSDSRNVGPPETSGTDQDSRPLGERVCVFAAVGTIVVALLGTLGWLSGPGFLDGLRNFSVLMSPVVAISLIVLAGILLALTQRTLSATKLALYGSLAVLVVGLNILAVGGHFVGRGLDFQRVLAPDIERIGETHFASMPVASETTCLLAGIAVLALVVGRGQTNEQRTRLEHWAGGLGSLVLASGFFFCLVCLWQSPLLYGPDATVPMTLSTAFALLTLGIAAIGIAGDEAIPLSLLVAIGHRGDLINERKALLAMTFIMIAASAAVMMIMAVMLHRHELQQHERMLQVNMRSQMSLILNAVRHDSELANIAADGNPDRGALGAILNRLMDEYERTVGLGETVEMTLAQREEDSIVFVVRRHSVTEDPPSVPWESDLAEPMRKALKGRSGTVTGLDYQGEWVLAAYGSIDVLNLGIVAKTRLTDIYAPFVRSSLSAGAVALVLVLAGIGLFYWVGTPMIARLATQTEHLRFEVTQRRESEERLRGFMDSAMEGFIILDSDLRIFSLNQVALGLFPAGETEDNLRGKHILEIAPAFQESGMYDAYLQVARTGHPMYYDGALAGPQFEDKHFSLNAFSTGGGVGIVFSDITEQKRIEKEIRANELRFRTIFEQSDSLKMLLDPNTPDGIPVIIDANQAMCQAHGYEYQELIGRPVTDIDDEELKRRYPELTQRILAGPPLQFEATHVRRDGTTFFVSIYGTRIQLPGEPPLIIATEFDITEQKRVAEELERHRGQLKQLVEERTLELNKRTAEAEDLNGAMVNVLEDLQASNLKLETAFRELQASNEELDAFSYSVSHDLRAPLRHISGFLGLLIEREKDRLDATSSRYVETITGAAERMGRLIDDLLSFSRTSRTELRLQYVDTNQVVQEAREELATLTDGRRVTWDISDLPAVWADAGLLRQVWQNLLGNAIKYTGQREDAHIEIGTICEGTEEGREGTEEDSGEVVFFVRDNGVGFDPQYESKLFGVFQRLHGKDEFEGTGIGLATVQRIINRFGGRIWAKGKVGQGATFYFTLKDARKDK